MFAANFSDVPILCHQIAPVYGLSRAQAPPSVKRCLPDILAVAHASLPLVDGAATGQGRREDRRRAEGGGAESARNSEKHRDLEVPDNRRSIVCQHGQKQSIHVSPQHNVGRAPSTPTLRATAAGTRYNSHGGLHMRGERRAGTYATGREGSVGREEGEVPSGGRKGETPSGGRKGEAPSGRRKGEAPLSTGTGERLRGPEHPSANREGNVQEYGDQLERPLISPDQSVYLSPLIRLIVWEAQVPTQPHINLRHLSMLVGRVSAGDRMPYWCFHGSLGFDDSAAGISLGRWPVQLGGFQNHTTCRVSVAGLASGLPIRIFNVANVASAPQSVLWPGNVIFTAYCFILSTLSTLACHDQGGMSNDTTPFSPTIVHASHHPSSTGMRCRINIPELRYDETATRRDPKDVKLKVATQLVDSYSRTPSLSLPCPPTATCWCRRLVSDTLLTRAVGVARRFRECVLPTQTCTAHAVWALAGRHKSEACCHLLVPAGSARAIEDIYVAP
ncbi:hypothetical protein OH76DRAFT_1423815 [Lentinus brumalis]|uniref:Uncharacterized protein n=1 Tax=Lentinus brumalis TaxID=2498619 RepID=A0A371CJ10_9APHY|nr:hypothetical protein OH76DRAFT_1423815 [Polyporus brumalis]